MKYQILLTDWCYESRTQRKNYKIPREIVRKHREISLIDKKKKEYEIH